MFVRVTIDVPGRPALAVPQSAIVRLSSQAFAFVVGDPRPDGKRRFDRRPIVIAEDIRGGWVPVLRGLSSGDSVAVSGTDFLVALP